MATCLMACFGQVVVARQDNIKVFSRLGGNYLGDIKVPSKTLSAFKQVRYLQQQAVRLCPHPKRTCEDLLLYVGQEQVGPPGMAYMDDLDEDTALQVQTLLKGCTRLEMMWDEDDAYAKSKVKEAGINVKDFGCCLDIELNGTDLPKELGYLGKKGKSRWHITTHTGTDICVDFSVFKMRYAISSSGFIHPPEVESLSLYNITPTNYMHCNVKNLWVKALDIDCKVFENLEQTETLHLSGLRHTRITHVVRNFQELAKLPNLKTLYLGDLGVIKLQIASKLRTTELGGYDGVGVGGDTYCNVKHLSVTASKIDCKSFAGLEQTERLTLYEVTHSQGPYVVRNFKELDELPNLKDLHLSYELVTPQGASELLDAMVLRPHVMSTSGFGEDYRDYRAQDVRVALPNMQLGQLVEPPKHMFAKHRLVATTLGCIALGMALAVGLTAL